ncbi:MAG TPA: YcxB family protein [Terriglobales bacterium]|nr:YcxB family protein [Terriglobales bacterium]
MKRTFRKQPGAHGPKRVTLDADGVHLRGDGGSSDVAWKNYIRWVEGKNQILLCFSPASFHILPKRALVPEQLVELRELLRQHIQSAK